MRALQMGALETIRIPSKPIMRASCLQLGVPPLQPHRFFSRAILLNFPNPSCEHRVCKWVPLFQAVQACFKTTPRVTPINTVTVIARIWHLQAG